MTLVGGSQTEVTAPLGARSAGLTRDEAEPRRLRIVALAPVLLVLVAIGFNLFVLRTEVRPVAGVNDIGAHAAMVSYAENRISDGKLVFDGWYPRLAMGFSQFHHYSSLPHIIAGAVATQFGVDRTVAWSNYLLLCFWPLCMYWAVRLFGFGRWTAGITALLAPLVVSVTGYGYEHGSYVWRGNGIWAQLWAMWLLPLTLAFTWRAVSRGKAYALAALFLALTIACHFFTAYLAIVSLGVWVVVQPRDFWRRLVRAAIVGAGGLLVASWVVVPLLADSRWASRFEAQTGTFWADSYGGKKVTGWLVSGELFDHGRWPVLSILVAIGALVCVWRFRRDDRARAVLVFTAVGLLLFCGRDTIGFVINRLPGGPDLLLHRFIIGVHLGGILLAGIGASWLAQGIYAHVVNLRRPRVPALVAVSGLLLVGLIVLTPAWRERARFDALGAKWINEQRVADATEGRDFTALARQAQALGGGRIYAGSAAADGGQIRIDQVPAYVYLLDANVDAIGFTLRELSLSSDVEVLFNDADPAHYNLFNVRHLILPVGRAPKVPATFVQSAGRWRLYEVPTTGYLQVVDTTTAIAADRTNMGQRNAAFLSSSMPGEGVIPVIAFAGARAATPTAPFGKPAGSPGVTVQYDRPDDGSFGGVVTVNRNAVVMLKATYDPRWHVTVDGKPAKTQMLAPSYVGVAVGPGQHGIEFRYVPYQYYWLLFTIGALALVALAAAPRLVPRVRRRAKERRRR